MKKILKITIKLLEHLPKVDMMGSCDPFCRILFCGQQQQTQYQKNRYEASWKEPLEFEIPKNGASSLSLEVLDYNQWTSSKLLGKVILSEAEMRKIASQPPGSESEALYEVKADGGKSLVGHDKYTTTILLSLAISVTAESEHPPAPGQVPSSPSVKKSLEVKVISVRNLPKMDQMGSCDPFCRVEFGGERYETKVVPNQYDADWNESFPFALPDATPPTALVLTVLDSDGISIGSLVNMKREEVVGQILFPAPEMAAVASRPSHWQEEISAVLLAPNGGNVLGEVSCIIPFRPSPPEAEGGRRGGPHPLSVLRDGKPHAWGEGQEPPKPLTCISALPASKPPSTLSPTNFRAIRRRRRRRHGRAHARSRAATQLPNKPFSQPDPDSATKPHPATPSRTHPAIQAPSLPPPPFPIQTLSVPPSLSSSTPPPSFSFSPPPDPRTAPRRTAASARSPSASASPTAGPRRPARAAGRGRSRPSTRSRSWAAGWR